MGYHWDRPELNTRARDGLRQASVNDLNMKIKKMMWSY